MNDAKVNVTAGADVQRDGVLVTVEVRVQPNGVTAEDAIAAAIERAIVVGAVRGVHAE